MTTLLLTLDYELYGNGSGDVFRHVVEPTARLLEIADKYGVRFTFFFEVIEYWKLKEAWQQGNRMGYDADPAEAMARQMREAVGRGHDVQLHLHPQWVGATYDAEKGWCVRTDEWRLGDYHREGPLSLTSLMVRGKQTLEDMLRPVRPGYRCTALRAGGYNAQPSEAIVRAMQEAGLTTDSSIYPGGCERGSLSRYDYSSVTPEKGFWHAGPKLETESNGTLLELPIAAFPIVRLRKYLSAERIRSLLRNRKSARDAFEAKTDGSHAGLLQKISYFFGTEWQTWDFCLFSPALHKRFLREAARLPRDTYVLVGHPKSFTGSQGLEYLLKTIKDKACFPTFTEAIAER